MTRTAERLGSAALEHARRLDWRFLLPDPDLGRAAYIGRPGGGLEQALRQADFTLAVAPTEATPEACDVAVVGSATPELVREAAAAVRPGGWVYAEALRRPARRAGADCARALTALRFEHVAVHWHWPDFERCAEVARLGDPLGARLALARRQAGPGARAQAGLARLLLAAGVLDLAIPCASVVGRRPGGRDEGSGTFALVVLSALRERLAAAGADPGGTPGYLLITPRFATSRHVIWLVAPGGRPSPTLAVKVPRVSRDRVEIERETANLTAIQAARPGGYETIPRVAAFEQVRGYPVLVQTALPGTPFGPRLVRRSPERAIEGIRAWLRELPLAGTAEPGWYDRLVEAPLRPLAGSPGAALGERALELLEPLRNESLPLVFEHGDVSHPNLIELPGGRIGAIDWELAEPRGLPLADLCFGLGYVAIARQRDRGLEPEVRALDDAFRRPGGWALPIVEAEAARYGVPVHAVPALVLASFARAAARARERAGDGSPGGGRYGTFLKLLVERGAAP